MKIRKITLEGLAIASCVVGCNAPSAVSQNGIQVSAEEQTQAPTPSPSPTQCGDSTNLLDILFVVDTSDDWGFDRKEIGRQLDSLVEQLPRGTDYQIGVLLGHGSDSPFSGKLWHDDDFPAVLSSDQLSLDDIEQGLQANLADLPHDWNSDDGEEEFYSLTHAFDKDDLDDSRAQGFFRPDAALAVIFVSENSEKCSRHRDDGEDKDEDNRDCDQITPASVFQILNKFESNHPLILSAILNLEGERDRCENHDADGTGNGYDDLIKLSDGLVVNLHGDDGDDFASALKQIGAALDTSLTQPCPTNSPSPTPSPSAAPSATPSVSPSVSPSPSPSVSPSPSASPSPCVGLTCGGGLLGV